MARLNVNKQQENLVHRTPNRLMARLNVNTQQQNLPRTPIRTPRGRPANSPLPTIKPSPHSNQINTSVLDLSSILSPEDSQTQFTSIPDAYEVLQPETLKSAAFINASEQAKLAVINYLHLRKNGLLSFNGYTYAQTISHLPSESATLPPHCPMPCLIDYQNTNVDVNGNATNLKTSSRIGSLQSKLKSKLRPVKRLNNKKRVTRSIFGPVPDSCLKNRQTRTKCSDLMMQFFMLTFTFGLGCLFSHTFFPTDCQ